MKEGIHIKEFRKTHKNKDIAEIMGCTCSAASQAVKSCRDIYFVEVPEADSGQGSFTFYEIKKPRKSAA